MKKEKTNAEALNEGTILPVANQKKIPTAAELKKQKEQENALKRQQQMMAKEEARQLAEYKRGLNDSISLKRLQVEELRLIIEYHELRKKHGVIQDEIMEEEAKRQAEEIQRQKEAEEVAKAEEAKVIPIKQGVARTEEEIKEALT